MTKLSDTQAIILSKASQHPDGLATPPESLPPAPRGAVAKRLLEAGLVEVLDGIDGHDPGLAWKLDGQAVFLRITEGGLQAIGVAAEADGATGQIAQEAPLAGADAAAPVPTEAAAEAAREAPAGLHEGATAAAGEGTAATPQDAHTAAQEGSEGQPGINDPTAMPTGSTAPLARAPGLHAAAQQVLAAWDDGDGDRARLADAIAALRAALPQPRAPRQQRQPGAPRTPRSGTKQDAVLALLRRPEGASGPDIIAATGWLPHTVRGFLAGLKKRGFEVLVHERVRLVGPGKEGAKGSYTVYRIAAEPAG